MIVRIPIEDRKLLMLENLAPCKQPAILTRSNRRHLFRTFRENVAYL